MHIHPLHQHYLRIYLRLSNDCHLSCYLAFASWNPLLFYTLLQNDQSCGAYYTLLIWQDNCYLERNDPHVHIETGLASWTFAAADENTPWLSSKKFTQSFDSSIFLDYISVAFIARSIRWTSSNFGSYPLSSNFLLNPDDLHLSMTWSQSFSVRLLPKLQFSAWCVNLITNWSTLSLFSCFIWQKMCLSYWMFAFGEKCSSNTFEAASHSYIPSLASIL